MARIQVDISDKTKSKLEKLKKQTGQTQNAISEVAIRRYVQRELRKRGIIRSKLDARRV